MHTKVADAIVSQLAAAGVERIYGVIGDALFPLAAALERQRAVRFVPAVHETNAAYMASYEAKLTGRPVACMATSGPGATNLATGLSDAYFDGAPVVAITGQVSLPKIGTGDPQYFDQQTFFKPITTSTETVMSGEAAMHALLLALERATRLSTATHLSIPKDVFEQPVAWSAVKLPTGANVEANRVVGDEGLAIERLRQAKRPLLIVGIRNDEVVQASLNLADTTGAAVIAAQQAKGTVPFDHPRLIGGIGEAHVPSIVNEADLVILVGDAPYELGFIPKHLPSVVVSPTHKGIMNHPLIAGWTGDVPGALGSLRDALEGRAIDDAWQWAIRADRHALGEQVKQLASVPMHEAVNPYALALKLSDHVAEDAVITVDTGAFSHWFDLGFRTQRQTVLTSHSWRPIGLALPAAIAAKIAQPHKQVIGIVGDGAFLQSMVELPTAVRFGLPVVVIVVNNATYDIERQKMMAEGFSTTGTDLPAPDYAALAGSVGAVGFNVTRGEELDAVIKQGLESAHDRPVVIDVKTSVPALPHPVAAG